MFAQRGEVDVMDIGGREIPANNQSHVVEHPTQLATVNPTLIEKTFFTDLSLLRLRQFFILCALPISELSYTRIPRHVIIKNNLFSQDKCTIIISPTPDEGKWRRFYFEVVFRWNILPKYFAS